MQKLNCLLKCNSFYNLAESICNNYKGIQNKIYNKEVWVYEFPQIVDNQQNCVPAYRFLSK